MKIHEIARKFGFAPRSNGLSEQLKLSQQRVDEAEKKAMEAFQQMRQAHVAVDLHSEVRTLVLSIPAPVQRR